MEAREGMKEGFARGGKAHRVKQGSEIKTLQAESGELIVERDSLARAFDR